MAVTDSMIKDQMPPGIQKSVGETKDAVGVIDERLQTNGDILAYQAGMMARARQGIAYQDGTNFSDEFVQYVQKLNRPKQEVYRSMSTETVNALLSGDLQRDQQYVNNNSEWTGYYLEPLAKFVVPFDTPFRNMLPRVPSPGIDVINWRAITDVFNGNGPAVTNYVLQQQDTNGPGSTTYKWVDKSNLLRMLAIQDTVTFESELYGRMFEPDVRAKVASKLAPTIMIGQETWYLNSGQKLWSPAPPNTISTTTSGGSLTAGTYWIIVTAVNSNGETLAWSIPPASNSVPLAASITTTGSTSQITFNIMRVPGASSYNVYVGINSTQPANTAMWLQSAATQFGSASALNDPGGVSAGYFSVTMGAAAAAASGTAYSTVVTAGNTAIMSKSTNAPANQALTFDGIQSLAMLNAGTLSTLGVGGETATVKRVADNSGTLAASDINTWLEAMYLNARANPECLLVSVKDHKALSAIVATSTNFRVNATPTGPGLSDLTGGYRATKWINQTTGRLMDIVMCPYLMQGTMVAVSLQLPFTVAEIDKPPLRIEVNRDLWAVEYPPDQGHMTQWRYAAFTNETMVAQFLGGQGLLTGIVTS